MVVILVEEKGEYFLVTVKENSSKTEHKVTLSDDYFEKLSSNESKEDFIKRSFEFLLKKEPKEMIMRSFDISLIQEYFPKFEEVI